MFTSIKIKTNDFLGKQEYFKQRYLKKQWSSIAMSGEDDAIETSSQCPTWFSALIAGAGSYFLRGEGVAGIHDLAYPMTTSLFGDLFVNQFKIGQTDAKLIPSYVPLAITEVKPLAKSVVVTYKGIGGGPDLIRLLSSGALSCKEHA
jgi:hypothetical protein